MGRPDISASRDGLQNYTHHRVPQRAAVSSVTSKPLSPETLHHGYSQQEVKDRGVFTDYRDMRLSQDLAKQKWMPLCCF